MMSTTAGGETSSDGREVIMIVQERERIVAEMTGMIGIKLRVCDKSDKISIPLFVPEKNIQT